MDNDTNYNDAHFLRSIIIYNPENGLFSWRNPGKRHKKIHLGCFDTDGYVVMKIRLSGDKAKTYKAHRLAWLYYYGHWPKNNIDHVNGIRSDNRIENLRDATNRENQQNRANHRNGRLPGAGRNGNKYQAQIQINKKTYYLGYFDTELEAHLAYKLAAQSIGDIE
jgi:hypothetical protein